MRYKLLGNTGLKVSELCLGAMTFGSQEDWCTDAAESRKMFDAFVKQGGNFIDTANIYTGGESEKLVGEFVASDRDRFVVASKYTHAMPSRKDPNAGGNHRKNLVQSLDASLKRLKLDYLDLYWVHVWDFTTPVEEVMRALDDAVSAGKILYTGFSDTPAWISARANTMAEARGWTPICALQLEYSLLERSIERELMPMARAMDIAVTAWSPLGGGVLSGKYSRSANQDSAQAGETKRLDSVSFRQLDDWSIGVAQCVDAIADGINDDRNKDEHVSSAQVALAWVRQQGCIPIIGARTLTQLEDNMASLNLTLSDTQMQQLNKASSIKAGHPYDLMQSDLVRALSTAGMADKIDNHRFPF